MKLIFCVSDQDHHQPPRSSARERSHFNIVTFSNYVMLLNCPRVVHPHPQQHAAQDRHPLAGNCCTVEFCATRCLSHLTFSFKSLSLKEHWSRKRLDTTQPKQTMNILFQSQMISLETALPLPRTLQLTQILGWRSTPPLSKVSAAFLRILI